MFSLSIPSSLPLSPIIRVCVHVRIHQRRKVQRPLRDVDNILAYDLFVRLGVESLEQ